jgi:hypothetical protein
MTQLPQQPNRPGLTPAQINRLQGYEPRPQLQQQRPPQSPAPAPAQPKPNPPAAPAAAATPVPETTKAVAPLRPDNRTAAQKLIDEIAPISFFGRPCHFDGKEGAHVYNDDKGEMPPGPWVVHYPMTVSMWVKFRGKGVSPDRIGGFLYDPDFVDTPREGLGDNDRSQWSPGLNGQPADPWNRQLCLVLEDPETNELVTWIARNETGRRAAANLLRHCNRVFEKGGAQLPLIMLKRSGYQHSLGMWVHTPVLQTCGRVPRTDAATPEQLSAASTKADEINDEIPF